MSWAPADPIATAAQIALCAVAFLVVLGFGLNYVPLLQVLAAPSSLENVRADLWQLLTAQITVAALTYPIVLGLVGVFVTRGRSSVRLDAYLHHSGAEFSGMSAFFLAALIALHLAVVERVPTPVSAHATWLYLAWFIGNVLAIAAFLHRTVKFLRPSNRETVYIEYALYQLWPRQLSSNLALHYAIRLFDGPLQARGGTQIRVDSLPLFAGDSEAVVPMRGAYPLRVADLWMRPMRWAIRRWATRISPAPGSAQPNNSSSQLRIILPAMIGSDYNSQTALVRVQPSLASAGNARPSRVEALIVQWSYRRRSARRHVEKQSVVELFIDILREAHVAVGEAQVSDFEDVLRAAASFHGQFLAASDYTDDTGARGNYANISDGLSFQSIDDEMHSAYRELIDKAVEQLAENEDYFRFLCYLASWQLRSYTRWTV